MESVKAYQYQHVMDDPQCVVCTTADICLKLLNNSKFE